MINFSPSSLNLIEQCQWAFKLKYIDKVKGRPTNCRNFTVGAVCDKLVTAWFKYGKCEKGWMQKHMLDYFKVYISKNHIVWLDLAKSTLSREKVLSDRALLLKRVYRAVPRIEAVILNNNIKGEPQRYGRIDMPHQNFRMTGKCDLFDWDDRIVYEMKVTESKEWLDRDQVLFYVALFTAIDKAKIEKAFFIAPLMKQRRLIPVPFCYRDLKSMIKRCNSAYQIISNDRFSVAGKNRTCGFCEYRGEMCPAWRGKDITWSKTEGLGNMQRVSIKGK